jgi:hypothetical protein
MGDLGLTIMTFPQSWDGAGKLTLNVLLLPVGDPLDGPLIGTDPAVPPFAKGAPQLEVWLDRGLAGRPQTSGAVRLASKELPGTVKADPVAGFTALAAKVTAAGTLIAPVPAGGTTPAAAQRTRYIRKALPPSYLAAGGERPDGTTTTTDEDFACDLRAHTEPSPIPDPPPPKPPVTWGEVVSYALRQPQVADWLGLRYRLEVTVDPEDVAAGAFVFAALPPGHPWSVAAAAAAAAMPPRHPLRLHAARVPPLDDTARAVFAAVQFHVDSEYMGALDDAVLTAETYADGFAKLVHCDQPATAEPTVDDGALAPSTDLGLMVGWDDHQVVAWLNAQLRLLGARLGDTLNAAADQPLGVLGYRVDVADVTPSVPGGPPRAPSWQSLVRVTADLGAPLGTHTGELCIQPAATKPTSSAAGSDAWLPRYFATWRGGSLCERDDTARVLSNRAHTVPPAPTRVAAGLTTLLSYGRTYAFRVRLCDLSSGGPDLAAEPVAPAPSWIATQAFRRLVPPKAPGIVHDGGQANPTPRWLAVTRPKIGYPEVLYTGLGHVAADRAAIRAALLSQAAGHVAGLPDPDVDAVEIDVAVRHLLHDPAATAGPFVTLYSTTRALAAPSGAGPVKTDPGTRVDLQYVEAPDLGSWTPPAAASGPVAIPRGRDVRLSIRSRLRPDAGPGYLGEPATRCLSAEVDLRCEPASEPALVVAAGAEPPIRGLRFNRPPDVAAPPLVAHLADLLGVAAAGDSLVSPPGRRTVFAASAALRHRTGADGERLTFSAPTQMLRNWIVAVVVDLARDWTWDGLLPEGLDVLRDGTSVGAIALPRVLGPLAAEAEAGSAWRRTTRLVFLDAVDPHEPVPGAAFPQATTHSWTLVPRRTPAGPPSSGAPGVGNEVAGRTLTLTLPIGVPPRQVPKLASVGLAVSPYVAGPAYASTEPRDRRLWIELEEPVANAEGDALFARVLAHGADPVLYAAKPVPTPPAAPPLPIEPELVRVVVPSATDDRAGEDAMARLTPSADSDRHFLLPLPPGVSPEDPELFGFYTYELRVGHTSASGDVRWWSTATARFGAPLRVVGVQHPPPALVCRAARRRLRRLGATAPLHHVPAAVHSGGEAPAALARPVALQSREVIVATAAYATPTLNGTAVVGPDEEPLTELWFCLYAQAPQVDGNSMRNILLINVAGRFLTARHAAADVELAQLFAGWFRSRRRDRTGYAILRTDDVAEVLESLHLPARAPLSALAIELLPPGTGTKVGFDRARPEESPLLARVVDDRDERPFPFGRVMRVSPLTPVAPVC